MARYKQRRWRSSRKLEHLTANFDLVPLPATGSGYIKHSNFFAGEMKFRRITPDSSTNRGSRVFFLKKVGHFEFRLTQGSDFVIFVCQPERVALQRNFHLLKAFV